MITPMATVTCECCKESPAAFALTMRAKPPAADGWRRALCRECLEWLSDTVGQIRGDGATGLLATPSGNGRALVFDDQCQVCRVPMAAPLAVVAEGAKPPWPKLSLCAACGAWLGSLAGSGGSARGRSFRVIDGHYGDWPHPNLRALSVEADIGDFAAHAAVRAACEKMGVPCARGGSILITEASSGGYARRRIEEDAAPRTARVVLTTLETEGDLRAAIAAGADDWITLPVTPQQVSGALTRALRGQNGRNRDEATLLPAIVSLPPLPLAILMDPLPGTTPFEAAWLCRRFARGYDDLGAYRGAIALFPRAPAADLGLVRARLEALLCGRVALRPADEPLHQARFEATG